MFVGGTVDESAPIILLVPPPALHLLMGPVNTLYVQLLKISPDCGKWSQQLHLKREDYHGGLFNGNNCRKLLKNLSILEGIAPPKALEAAIWQETLKHTLTEVRYSRFYVFYLDINICNVKYLISSELLRVIKGYGW